MIHLLPGMGADERMYPGPWRALPDCRMVNWTPYRDAGSIAEVALRLILLEGIDAGTVFIGSSFGGMVACEVANHMKVGGLILVGSARSRTEIGFWPALLRPLVQVAPMGLLQRVMNISSGEFSVMFRDADPTFIRAMCRAISAWEGLRAGSPAPLRIHGRRDRLIPPPAGVDYLLPGGHLIAMTHASECVEIVRHFLRGGPPVQ